MHQKYLKAIEPLDVTQGQEVLANLGIQDGDKFEKTKLIAIEQAVASIQSGKPMKESVNEAIADAKGAIATTQSQSLSKSSPGPNPETIQQPLKDRGNDTAFGVVQKIGEYTNEASQDIEQGLEAFVKGAVYEGAKAAFDSEEWNKAALEAIRGGKSQA